MIKKLLICFGLATAVHAIERPNIIFIMVDDMGRDWVIVMVLATPLLILTGCHAGRAV